MDLHRDDARKNITTKNINGKNYARLYFILGRENPSFEKIKNSNGNKFIFRREVLRFKPRNFIKDRKSGTEYLIKTFLQMHYLLKWRGR